MNTSASRIPGKAHDWAFMACTAVSYVLLAGLAFALHPALGLLALLLGYRIAPLMGVALMALLPLALMAGALLVAFALAVYYFAMLAASGGI